MPTDRLYSRTRLLLQCGNAATKISTPSLLSCACRRPWRFHSTQSRYSTSSTPRVEIDPRVDVKSLASTLAAHRAANRAVAAHRRPATQRECHPALDEAQDEDLVAHDGRGLKGPSTTAKPKAQLGHERGKDLRINASTHSASEHTSGRGLQPIIQVGGRVALPTFQWALDPSTPPSLDARWPWTSHLKHEDLPIRWATAEEQLTREIEAFDLYVSPTPEERAAADLALEELRQVVKRTNQHMDMDLIGSRATGTAGPLSDIDVNVSLPVTPSSMKARLDPEHILDTLRLSVKRWKQTHQNKSCPIEVVYFVRKAVVPILLCRHVRSGIPIQIQSTARTYDSTEYVRSFLKEFPTLRSLFKVLKQTLSMRGLANGQAGGLTSYPLINMILASLKLSESKIRPENSAAQLLFFLEMYCDINFDTTGISIRPPALFSKKQAAQRKIDTSPDGDAYRAELEGQRYMALRGRSNGQRFILQDPANPMNNLGRSASRIKDLQETLIALRQNVLESMQAWDERRTEAMGGTLADQGNPNTRKSIIAALVEGDYHVYKHDRNDLALSLQRHDAALQSRAFTPPSAD